MRDVGNNRTTRQAAEAYLSVGEFSKRLGLPKSSGYRLLANEPGVLRIVVPGSSKPIIRVPLSVLDRIVRRSAIHE